MTNHTAGCSTRRTFLKTALTLAGGLPFVRHMEPAVFARGTMTGRYRALTPKEGVFSEKLVNVLCPHDEWTPNGVTCGLARAIDDGLAADPSQSAAKRYTSGIAAADRICQERFGLAFVELPDRQAAEFLRDMATGCVTAPDVSLASWVHDAVYPALQQASFAEPIHDGYSNKVFWKLFGYLGDPIAYCLKA